MGNLFFGCQGQLRVTVVSTTGLLPLAMPLRVNPLWYISGPNHTLTHTHMQAAYVILLLVHVPFRTSWCILWQQDKLSTGQFQCYHQPRRKFESKYPFPKHIDVFVLMCSAIEYFCI